MNLSIILRKVELFNGLSDSELQEVASICNERVLKRGEVLTLQGETSDDLYIITEGFVEIILEEGKKDPRRVVVNLGEGQIIGEMSLVDRGPRSATAQASGNRTVIQVIRRKDIESLFDRSGHIGYVVMRNIASDLSFKLRHRNLSEGSR
jgi:CRP-like cAMP-binding protein